MLRQELLPDLEFVRYLPDTGATVLTPQQDPATAAASMSPRADSQADSCLAAQLQRAVVAHQAGDDAAMRDALSLLCSAARQSEIPVERVLVQLKQLWHARTADVPLRAGPTDDRLAVLVSTCISTYYQRNQQSDPTS